MFNVIPLLSLVVIAYFGVAISVPSALVSPALWMLTTGDLLVACGLFLLYLEILKSVRTSIASVIEHGLSLALFNLCPVLFITVPMAGTGTFFLILVMTFLDVIAGFTFTLAASRRSVDIAGPM